MKQILALVIAGFLVSLGLCLALASFLILVVFAEGPITPRSYTPGEKVRQQWNGSMAGAGAAMSFTAAAVLCWWGRRNGPDTLSSPRDKPPPTESDFSQVPRRLNS